GQLQRLLDQHPTYLAALLHLGQRLNDLKDFAAAVTPLERALALDADSAQALAELGRARAGQGDLDGARRDLQRAVTLNPYHGRAWQYLLQLLGRQRGTDAASWAQQAHRLHPANILLALQGVRLYPEGETIAA